MQYDDVSQLPPRYQEQARQKLAAKSNKVSKTGQAMNPTERDSVAQAKQRAITEGPSRGDAIRKKYRNQEMVVEGRRFDSKKEARRFLTLREMEKCGEIYDLRLQQDFTLQEAYTVAATGKRNRAIRYRADFTYYRKDENGNFTIYIVEDVKSKATRTREYINKKKMLLSQRGIEITEV